MFKKLRVLLVALFYTIIVPVSFAADNNIVLVDIPNEVLPYLKDYDYELNQYGNLIIKLKKQYTHAISNLRNIRDIIHKKWDKRGILLYVPIAFGNLERQIINLDFVLYDLDKQSNHIVYVYRNGRAIPNISSPS